MANLDITNWLVCLQAYVSEAVVIALKPHGQQQRLAQEAAIWSNHI